jgi:hypothetical protein
MGTLDRECYFLWLYIPTIRIDIQDDIQVQIMFGPCLPAVPKRRRHPLCYVTLGAPVKGKVCARKADPSQRISTSSGLCTVLTMSASQQSVSQL